MVLLIIIPVKWLFHWEYTLFSDKPIFQWDVCRASSQDYEEALQDMMENGGFAQGFSEILSAGVMDFLRERSRQGQTL